MRKRNAFTLIELIVVLAIIGILTALIAPAVREASQRARQRKQEMQAPAYTPNVEKPDPKFPQQEEPVQPSTSGHETFHTIKNLETNNELGIVIVTMHWKWNDDYLIVYPLNPSRNIAVLRQ